MINWRFTTCLLGLLIFQGCSNDQTRPGQTQPLVDNINFIAVVSTHTAKGRGDVSLTESRTGVSAKLYQLSSATPNDVLLNQQLPLPADGCSVIRSGERTDPWLYNDISLTNATPISVGQSIDVIKSSTLTSTTLSELTLGEYEYSNSFEYLIEDGEPVALLLSDSDFKTIMDSELYPVKRPFEWVVVTSFGNQLMYTNGFRPESYSLDFSLRWPVIEQENDSVFIKAWTELDSGAEIAVYCLVDETGVFSIPTDTQNEIASLGLDAFEKIYISRLAIESSVIDDVLIVKTAESTHDINGGDRANHLYTDVIQQ